MGGCIISCGDAKRAHRVTRSIVVLVHAHVTLDQALSAVQAEQICGVVTLPCCNWYGQQESLFGRGPDLVYDDFSVLSDHREVMGCWHRFFLSADTLFDELVASCRSACGSVTSLHWLVAILTPFTLTCRWLQML